MNTPTRPATAADNTPLDRAYLRAPRVPVITIPFDAAHALQLVRDECRVRDGAEDAIVELAEKRYGTLPAAEQDGDIAWLVSWAVDKCSEEDGDDEPNGRCDWMGVERW